MIAGPPLTVSFDASDGVTYARHQAALATLAASFRIKAEPGADIAVVSGARRTGRSTSWQQPVPAPAGC